MKNMKRIISMLLMLCMMAALMAVPAFAEELPAPDEGGVSTGDGSGTGDGSSGEPMLLGAPAAPVYTDVTISPPDLIPGNYTIPAGETSNQGFRAYVSTDTGVIPSDAKVIWSLNGKTYTASVGADNSAYVEYAVSEFDGGDNILTATIQGTDISDGIIVSKSEAQVADKFELIPDKFEIASSGTAQVSAYLNDSKINLSRVHLSSSDDSILTVDASGLVTAQAASGSATIRATLLDDNGVATATVASCTISVSSTPTAVHIDPIPTTIKKGQTIEINASVSGTSKKAVFKRWYVDSAYASYVSIAQDRYSNTTLTAKAVTNSPIRLYAVAEDGTEAYVQFSITYADAVQLEAYPEYIYKGETTRVSVINPIAGEDFTWTITPSATYGVLATNGGYKTLGTAVELTAGALEGRVTVTATSKSDSSRTATTTVYVNSEPAFGFNYIKPEVATWSAGQGDLKFEVFPYFYKAYVDGKLLTPASGYYTYLGGILTIKTSLLSTLSTGEHSLKVYTSSGNGIDGLVYATIYVNGTAKSVYGDNAHVRGSNYNLYFTSTDPISSVSINGTYVDPSNYTLDNNGRRLTLHANYLNKLGYGSYNMKLNTVNGYTENASFRIVTANYAPATGDNNNIGAWICLMLVSAAGAVALIPRKKKSTDLIG